MRVLAAAAVLALAGCGGDDERLVVSAAASLQEPLTACRDDERLAFAGSDELAAQIRQGVRPGVFAAANTALPEQLAAAGLAREPVVFATNELVIAAPADGDAVTRLEDLATPDLDLVLGAESVPVGAYAREVLGRLDADLERAILENVRSEEPDVTGVIGKLANGAADAGLVYATDVAAADGDLEAIPLPDALQPQVEYGAAVVENSPAARRYLAGLTDGACADALRAAGFGPPPRP